VSEQEQFQREEGSLFVFSLSRIEKAERVARADQREGRGGQGLISGLLSYSIGVHGWHAGCHWLRQCLSDRGLYVSEQEQLQREEGSLFVFSLRRTGGTP